MLIFYVGLLEAVSLEEDSKESKDDEEDKDSEDKKEADPDAVQPDEEIKDVAEAEEGMLFFNFFYKHRRGGESDLTFISVLSMYIITIISVVVELTNKI